MYCIVYFAWCNEMVYLGNICSETKALIRFLWRQGDLTMKEIVHWCGISRASVYRCLKKCNSDENTTAKLRGRPPLINKCEERIIEWNVKRLRRKEEIFRATE